ncbi:unnamed protein product [Haemonchus placei]|uniref:Phorbol-ester/DAG-type domain-containing protein n=1 Tax=Haemonchus placei TaxID=6290 RepID=A0A0N4X1H4_HAEPC|nr:unnamed protein product [Haemonchus placei]
MKREEEDGKRRWGGGHLHDQKFISNKEYNVNMVFTGYTSMTMIMKMRYRHFSLFFQKICGVCGGLTKHRDIVQNITVCTKVCQQNTIEEGDTLAQVLRELESLQQTREMLRKKSAELTHLWTLKCPIIRIYLLRISTA